MPAGIAGQVTWTLVFGAWATIVTTEPPAAAVGKLTEIVPLGANEPTEHVVRVAGVVHAKL